METETGKGADALDRRPQLAAALGAARVASVLWWSPSSIACRETSEPPQAHRVSPPPRDPQPVSEVTSRPTLQLVQRSCTAVSAGERRQHGDGWRRARWQSAAFPPLRYAEPADEVFDASYELARSGTPVRFQRHERKQPVVSRKRQGSSGSPSELHIGRADGRRRARSQP